MKKTNKIIIAILVIALMLTMAIGLTACNKTDSENTATFNFLPQGSDNANSVNINLDDFNDKATVYDVFTKAELKYGFGAEFGAYDMLVSVKMRGLLPNTLQSIWVYTDQKPETITAWTKIKKVGGKTYYSASVGVRQLKLSKGTNYLFAVEENEYFDKGIKINQTMHEGWDKSISEPVVVGDDIYATLGNEILKLKETITEDGTKFEIVDRKTLPGATYFGMVAPIVAGDKIIVGYNGGVRAFDKDLNLLWTYTIRNAGDMCSPIAYDKVGDEEFIYVEFYNKDNYNTLVCLNIKDENTAIPESKEAKWTGQKADLYHGGVAVVKNNVVVKDRIDGKPVLAMLNKNNGEKVATLNVEGVVRGQVVYEEELNSIFFTTETGKLYRVYLDKDGKFATNENSVRTLKLKYDYSNSTPAIYKNRLYVSSGKEFDDKTGAAMHVINVDTMTEIYNVETKDPTPAKPQVRVTDNNGVEEIFVFFTKNTAEGGLYYLVDTSVSKKGMEYTLFTPEASQQNYCISKITFDKYGNIYYKNDSNTLFKYHLGINWVDNKF